MKKQPGGKMHRTQPFSLRKQFLAMSAIVLVLGMIGIGFLQLRQCTDDKRRQGMETSHAVVGYMTAIVVADRRLVTSSGGSPPPKRKKAPEGLLFTCWDISRLGAKCLFLLLFCDIGCGGLSPQRLVKASK